jgi:hypothetical protein
MTMSPPLALEMGARPEDVALAIHTHPTMSEPSARRRSRRSAIRCIFEAAGMGAEDARDSPRFLRWTLSATATLLGGRSGYCSGIPALRRPSYMRSRPAR